MSACSCHFQTFARAGLSPQPSWQSVTRALAVSVDTEATLGHGQRTARTPASMASAALATSTAPAKGCWAASRTWSPLQSFHQASLIIFHCIFLKGCYDFLVVWWLAINQAFLMSCERALCFLVQRAQAEGVVSAGHRGRGWLNPFPAWSGTARLPAVGAWMELRGLPPTRASPDFLH